MYHYLTDNGQGKAAPEMKNCTTKLHMILNQPRILHAKIIRHAMKVKTKWWTEH